MPEAPFAVIVGPAEVWVAPVATTFPVVNVAPAVAWLSLGKTDGGVTVTHGQTQVKIRVDQVTAPLKIVRTEEDLTIAFNLAELTLETYGRMLNAVTPTADAGPPATKKIGLYQNVDVSQWALLIRGGSPYGDWNMQYEIPKVAQSGAPSVKFTRDDKAVLSVEFVALYDSSQSAGEEFGRLKAQSA
jgi:hypothetical protein